MQHSQSMSDPYSLPPSTVGPRLGELSFSIDNVCWFGPISPPTAGPILVRARWWGEESGNAASLFAPTPYQSPPTPQEAAENTRRYSVRGDLVRYLAGSSSLRVFLSLV